MSIAEQLAHERAYIAANQDRVATELARDPDKRAEAMSEIAHMDAFALVLSLDDDAELGRWLREEFWTAMHEMARNECEYLLADQAEATPAPELTSLISETRFP